MTQFLSKNLRNFLCSAFTSVHFSRFLYVCCHTVSVCACVFVCVCVCVSVWYHVVIHYIINTSRYDPLTRPWQYLCKTNIIYCQFEMISEFKITFSCDMLNLPGFFSFSLFFLYTHASLSISLFFRSRLSESKECLARPLRQRHGKPRYSGAAGLRHHLKHMRSAGQLPTGTRPHTHAGTG